VDLLVVTKNKADTSLDIRRHLDVMFGLDPVVYTLKRLQERVDMGDWFLRDIDASYELESVRQFVL
jgi:hypothetical protein